MTYNQQRHRQFLKRSQNFENQSKSFYEENSEEFLELCNSKVAVEDKIFWQQRYKVDELMQDFRNRKIDGEEFYDQVIELRRNLMIATDKSLV